MSWGLPFRNLDWSFGMHEMTIRLHEVDEITRRECNVPDGDIPVVWHQSRWGMGRAGKIIKVGDEVLWLVSFKEFLHFLTCDFELWPYHGNGSASWGALAN